MRNIKEEIISVFIEEVKKRKNIDISVKEICLLAHISRPTFYKHFKDKYEIIEAITNAELIEPVFNAINSGIKNIKLLTETFYMNFYKNKDFYKVIIKTEGQNSFFDTVIYQLTENNKKLYENVMDYETINYVSYKFATSQAMLLKKWINEGMVVPPERMANYYLYELTDIGKLLK